MTDHRSPRPTVPSADQSTVIAVDFSEVRTGEDVRQRGWFWHWNELHTEYGPLLRQSGIGLLTSYIVYTDRRENSPQRGYAFPSLQLQAAFTGADRAELITINQILVALDLLEIRKEMVVRADERGRKWRVPHNLYRVKDKSDSRHLTAADVLRVLELAEKKREVYRHIRHVFSANFTPISRGNIWHGLREELRATPIWQRLAARAERDEAKFSERSRAGHAARKSNAAGATSAAGPALELIPSIEELRGEVGPIPSTPEMTVAAETGRAVDTASVGQETLVAGSNRALATRVASSNEALDPDRPSTGGGSNEAWPSSVAPSNPMYDQSLQTTRTTPAPRSKEGLDEDERGVVTTVAGLVTAPVTSETPGLSQVNAPGHGPDRAVAVLAFAEANGRDASPAEERLLTGIAHEGDQLVEAGATSGWAVVAAAIYEAVDSGSSYVAPKRVREIVRRWLRDGVEGEGWRVKGTEDRGQRRGDRSPDIGSGTPNACAVEVSNAHREPDTELPTPKTQDPTPMTEYPTPTADSVGPHTSNQQPATNDRFWVEEGQLSSTLLWETIVGELAERGIGRRGDLEMYLRPARFVGRSGERGFLLEAPNGHARRRIELHWLAELERGLARLLGGTGWEIEVSVREESRRAG